jgi:N-acetylglucosaminyl-diphospho-decaprenol L-rhamnosyltransferase
LGACAIIVSYRTGPVLAKCLASFAAASGLDEILIVDNGSDADEAAAIDAFAANEPRARVLRGQGNVGFAAACNLGARQATSQVLVFANPDVTLQASAIERLSAALSAAPPPAIVGGDLRDEQGRPERGSRRERLTLWRAFVTFTGLSRLERAFPALRDFNRHRDPLPDHPVAVGAISGALMCMRRADLEALGGFDEGYFLHVEDVDLCRRAEQAGWRVLFQPGPHGVHLRSTSAAPASSVGAHKARGFARYFRKFARSPLERVLGEVVGAALMVILPLTGPWRGARSS